MKNLLFIVLSVLSWSASLGMAQSLSELLAATPSCALPCLLTGLESGNCSLTDLPNLATCTCTNIKLQSSLSACVQTSCAFVEQVQAAGVLGELCAPFPKESRTTEVKITAITCLVLTLFFVLLRCLSRASVSSRLWWDDWTTLLATLFLGGLCGAKIAASGLGFGLHYWDVNPEKAATIFQLFYAAQMLYILIQVTAKVSILILFWRIFTARWFRIAIWSCAVFLIGHGFIFLMLVAFQCTPVAAVWDKTIVAKCLSVSNISKAGAIFSILEDLVILALPIPEVLKLQLTFKKKVAICLMFSIGSFACVTSIVRLKFTWTLVDSLDATWDNVAIVVWSIIEVTCAIICGCLPTLRPLLMKVPGLLTSAKASDYIKSTTISGKDRHSRARSEILAPGAFRKLSDAPWEVEGSRDAKSTRSPIAVSTKETGSGWDSKDDIEMGSVGTGRSPVTPKSPPPIAGWPRTAQ